MTTKVHATTAKVFNELNSDIPLASRKAILHGYLAAQIEARNSDPTASEEIAYHIAGLLATETARCLDNSDPYRRALLLAGQLELPERHRSPETTWDELERLVRRLP